MAAGLKVKKPPPTSPISPPASSSTVQGRHRAHRAPRAHLYAHTLLTAQQHQKRSSTASTSPRASPIGVLRARLIVFTNGCFDLLHVGHITAVKSCRKFGTKLVLGSSTLTPPSSCRLKGPTRPIVSERERARVMSALAAVDADVLFAEDTPFELIREINPYVLVKGGDYTIESVICHEVVLAAGGRIEIVPTVEGFSTTNIVRKLTGSAPE